MKRMICVFTSVVLLCLSAAAAPGTKANPRILIAYFGRVGNMDMTGTVDASSAASINLLNGEYVGNTELVARWIQETTGGDLFLIETEERYPLEYNGTVRVAEGQNRDDVRPALASHIGNVGDYDVIFVGYPVWNYDLPVALDSFLEEYDFTGKTIIPFCTSGGSTLSLTLDAVRRYQPNAKIREGITVSHSRILSAKNDAVAWLRRLGYTN